MSAINLFHLSVDMAQIILLINEIMLGLFDDKHDEYEGQRHNAKGG